MKAAHKRAWRWLIGVVMFVFVLAAAWKIHQANEQIQRDDALWTAVERGDLFAVTVHLNEGANPNLNEYQVLDRRNRGTIAAIASRLLGRKPRYNFDPGTARWTADPRLPGNWTTRQEWNTVLWLATQSNRPDIVRALIEKGAKDQATGYLETTLMWAASAGHADIVRSLLAGGSDVNASNDFGDTALEGAVMRDDSEIIQLLLQHGADPRRGTALTCARERGHTAIIALLESKLATNGPAEFRPGANRGIP